MNPGTREEGEEVATKDAGWPEQHLVVYLKHDGTLGLDKPDGWWKARTFWSSDAPCVLTPEEARLIADNLSVVANRFEELAPLCRRLDNWAEEERN